MSHPLGDTEPCRGTPSMDVPPADVAGVTTPTDGQLLERFVLGHEDAAFRALLERHGPMVLGVCRRILRHEHDADDAFQATFLVLIRRAASIAKRESVASWLYGVAYRIAARAKTQTLRRRAYERQAGIREMADPFDEILWRDLRPVLDEEVQRLPEKYRGPVVLCYLEGRPYAEAARQLRCSTGSIALRLATARTRLRDRLDRRGVVLGVGILPALLAPQRVTVPVPERLAETTARAALHWIMGGPVSALPASVMTLTQAGLRALTWAKVKIALAALLATSVAVGAAGATLHRVVAERSGAAGIESAGPRKGRKTLQDRLDGLPLPRTRSEARPPDVPFAALAGRSLQ